MHIFLIDDHQMFAEALKNVIERFICDCKVSIITDARSALQQLEHEPPDLILLDLELEGMSGLDLLRVLPQHGRNIPILVCSGNLTPKNVQAISMAGVKGYMRKSESIDDVKKAITAASQGKYYPGGFNNWASSQPSHNKCLTNRQLAILTLMKSGMSNNDIASTLYLSLNTIKTHVRLMYEALEVSSRIECLNRAQSLGYLDDIHQP